MIICNTRFRKGGFFFLKFIAFSFSNQYGGCYNDINLPIINPSFIKENVSIKYRPQDLAIQIAGYNKYSFFVSMVTNGKLVQYIVSIGVRTPTLWERFEQRKVRGSSGDSPIIKSRSSSRATLCSPTISPAVILVGRSLPGCCRSMVVIPDAPVYLYGFIRSTHSL